MTSWNAEGQQSNCDNVYERFFLAVAGNGLSVFYVGGAYFPFK